LFGYRYYSSHCIHSRRMRTYQHTTFAVIDRYDIFYGGYKSDAGVGSGRRYRFLNSYGFRFSTTLWNILIELRDSVVFSVIKTVFSMFDVYCAYLFYTSGIQPFSPHTPRDTFPLNFVPPNLLVPNSSYT
jgi:hypothetical protein